MHIIYIYAYIYIDNIYIIYIYIYIQVFLKWGIPQAIGLNTKMV